jgi:hypothetical protein
LRPCEDKERAVVCLSNPKVVLQGRRITEDLLENTENNHAKNFKRMEKLPCSQAARILTNDNPTWVR